MLNQNFVVTDAYIISGVIFILLSFLIPCSIWLVRNGIRAFKRKEYYALNKVLKYSWIIGIFIFILGIILLTLKVIGTV